MALLSTDDLVASLTLHRNFIGFKADDGATGNSEMYMNRFFCSGSWGTASTTAPSASGTLLDSSTSGAMPIDAVITTNNLMYLGAVSAMKETYGQIILVDRLWHGGGYSLTTTSSQTINSTTLDRPDADGEGTEIWFEVAGTMGTTPGTLTATYTNSAGTGSRTATWVYPGGGAGLHHAMKLTMQPGDTGVKSIQSCAWSSAPGSSGVSTYRLAIVRRLAVLHNGQPGSTIHYGPFSTGMPRIYDDSCLALYTYNATSNPGDVWISVKLAETTP